MKCTVVFDPTRPEEIMIYAHKPSALIESVQALCEPALTEVIGYEEKEAVRLKLKDVTCFVVESDRVVALCDRERYVIKARLYELEENLPKYFIRIHQSCIANTEHITRFDASLAGTLRVRFRNGHCDYVSRRNIKAVKERFGL